MSRRPGTPHATPGSILPRPNGKRSIFGIAGDRPCTPRFNPLQLPQALWEDIWEKIDMPNQKSYEVSIHPNPTPGEPVADPAVGGEILKAVGWNKSRHFENQEKAMARSKVYVRGVGRGQAEGRNVRQWSRSSPRNRIGKPTLKISLSKRTADPPMAPAGCFAGRGSGVWSLVCN